MERELVGNFKPKEAIVFKIPYIELKIDYLVAKILINPKFFFI
jgi:hypothetical protein